MMKLSFKWKLYLAVGFLSVLALGNAGYLAYGMISTSHHDKQAILELAAEAIADKVDRNLFERYGDVQAYALSEPARSGDPVRIQKFINDMMAAYTPVYDVMMVLDKTGHVIAINGVDKGGKALDPAKMIGKNYAKEDWFISSMSGKISAGAAYFSDLQMDPDTQAYAATDGRVMTFVSPIRNAETGEILGVWCNRMSWKDVVEDILVKESAKIQRDTMPVVAAYLMTPAGLYLAHHDSKKVLTEKFAGISQFDETGKTTWGHNAMDEEQIKGEAVEVFTRGLGYGSYPGRKWVYQLRAPKDDVHLAAATRWSIVGLLSILLMAVTAVWVAGRASSTLEMVITHLRETSHQVAANAGSVTGAAQDLSANAVQQASALQQTAASIEEINATLVKNSENAAESEDLAGSSADMAKRGQESVVRMTGAINEINISNEAILHQIGENNLKLGEIAKLISEIGQKTMVIDDIVFQTKLLSFNASVEAARAGEAGRGFAVVAEEVGNLASMSGSAAKEISEMLNQSIHRVEGIVAETRTRVEALVSEGRGKVQAGADIASECAAVLDDVVRNADQLKAKVSEISIASREQAHGVKEISKAMNELDTVTATNSRTSQEVSGYAGSLAGESRKMDGIVVDLAVLVTGSAGSSKAA